eukprot:3881083-Rhodomonas_salina.1
MPEQVYGAVSAPAGRVTVADKNQSVPLLTRCTSAESESHSVRSELVSPMRPRGEQSQRAKPVPENATLGRAHVPRFTASAGGWEGSASERCEGSTATVTMTGSSRPAPTCICAVSELSETHVVASPALYPLRSVAVSSEAP